MKKHLLLGSLLLFTVFQMMADDNLCIQFSTTAKHDNPWDDQASYTPASALAKGHNYTLQLKAKATQACDLCFWPIWTTSPNKNQWGGSTDVQYLASYKVSTQWQTFTWKFVADFNLDRLDWEFGGLKGNICFDDIKLVDDQVGVNIVTNGDFANNSTQGWSTQSGYMGTSFKIVTSDSGKDVPDPEEPQIPDTWELAEQGDPNFHVYLCFGQSNMEGNAQPEEQDKKDVPARFKMMAAANFSSPVRKVGEWYTAVPPICRQGTGLTPADYFGRTLVEELPEVTVGVINVAVGGAKIELFMEEKKDAYIAGEADWFRGYCAAYDNDPLGRLVAMGKLAQKVGVIKGILLHQGESNNGDASWAENVGKIYKRICYYLGLDPAQVPLLAGETLYQDMGGACYWHNQSALPNLKNAVPNSYVISAKGIPGNGVDPWHFSAAGYREFGRRYAAQMLKILNAQSGIESVGEEPMNETPCYNLYGQPIGRQSKGLLLSPNGKKYVR